MSTISQPGRPGPSLVIRGTAYPVLLPSLRDPRLRLAAVITSLQVLGQVAFDFRLSIGQILLSLGTCALIETTIVFRRRRVIMWPASALLTGNGVAFVLRVPGTQHGDWWSLQGWWIFVGTAAIALLSKHVLRLRGEHVFNPSNLGLVITFLALGSSRAEPLDFWWGPMSWWMGAALGIIVAGGFAVLHGLRLLEMAAAFWVTFAAGVGVLAVSGHAMTARWHLGPLEGLAFWKALVLSPEILVFLFFMITDPRTTPASRPDRRVFAIGVGLLSVLLIAPFDTEFASKVAVLGALVLACGVRPMLALLGSRGWRRPLPSGPARAGVALAGALAAAGVLVLAGLPARPSDAVASGTAGIPAALPQIVVGASHGVASRIDAPTSRRIAADLLRALEAEEIALGRRSETRARVAASGAHLQTLWTRIRASEGAAIEVPTTLRVDRVAMTLEAPDGQGPPMVVARVTGLREIVTYGATARDVLLRDRRGPFDRTLLLLPSGGRYRIAGVRGTDFVPARTAAPLRRKAIASGLGDVRFTDVAKQAGIDFRQGTFRYGVDGGDTPAMMGGGVCWLDADRNGWLDLFAVNSFADRDRAGYAAHGGLPTSRLFLNLRGRFRDATAIARAGLPVRGTGCVAADLDGDGSTDLVVTGAETLSLLWNNGDGTFTEGAQAAGLTEYGWHTGAAVGDVDGDGRVDLFVAGYLDRNAPIPSSQSGFPGTFQPIRDLLYLNTGPGQNGRARFREVGERVGLDAARPQYGLGALFTDVNGDGRLDLYVANDTNPNRLYENRPAQGAVGFRFVEVGRRERVDDPNAGMGIASGDYTGDGRADLVVTNSHSQLHAVYRSLDGTKSPRFADGQVDLGAAFDTRLAGWGVAWIDAANDGRLDLVVANGAIPVLHPKRDTEPIQLFTNRTAGGATRFVDATAAVGLDRVRPVIGRGLAVADFDNDGRQDVAVNTVGGRLVLLRGTGRHGHWLEVALPRFPPGTVVSAMLPNGRRLLRETHAGSSYLSSEDPRVHFGLGGATRVVTLEVRPPGGAVTRLENLAPDRIVTVQAPRG